MENQEFEILLNKFIEGKISSDELSSLENSKEFSTYKKILDASSEFSTPHVDNDKSFDAFMEKTKSNTKENTPVRKLNPFYVVSGVAASLLFLFGLFQFLNTNQTYSTGFGEQLAVVLPDNSEVVLNSDSYLEFNKKEWEKNRKLNLKGEAYFKVQKGSKFEVITPEGTVAVLGTQFNVNQHKNFLEVHCFEGKVSVARNNKEFILTQGDAVRQIGNSEFENWNFSETKPTWKDFENSFKNTPLRFVVESLIKTYGATIITDNVDLEKRFSGSFPTNDIDIALKTITTSMNLNYDLEEGNKVTLRSKE
ncbi:FecR family protein [uncultured Tenacibaculum sp.]|uniref:FecR family protein n=1 Tax=uncultured Tenacibaculum sp. TaxID=174713 RepID=UPI002625AC9E|nr:FecR family protein [uncultured Tenacibaculum sp.]